MSIFGKNPDYDLKCLKLFKIDDNKENTIQNLENIIKSDTEMLENMGKTMDSACINGYKWSDEMVGVIKYYTDMLTWFKDSNN